MTREVLTIGVTGHRSVPEGEGFRAALSQALERIEQAFPAERTVVLSPLAEGADQAVALQALERPGTSLVVPLALPLDEYLADFHSDEGMKRLVSLVERAERVVSLLPVPTRVEAYRQVGRYVVDHCDVLIAVWDGQPAKGPGGTGEIVAEARHLGLPLAWIHAANGEAAPKPLQISYERFPG